MPNKITKITTPDNTEYDIVDDKAYHTDDSTSTDIADGDYIPLSSASAKKKSTFSNLVAKIKAKLITDTYSGTSTIGMSGKAVKSAIDALDGTVTGSPSASKTLTAFSQTDGKVSATFGDISISKSQINDFPTIPTVNDASLTINQNGTLKGEFTANDSDDVTVNLTDENVKQIADTATSWRRLALVENNNTEKSSNVFKNSSFWCCTSPIGTTSTVGKSFLAIGNNTSSGTDGNSKGYLRIYGENNKRSQITINGSVTADREVYLPNKDGTIALTDDIKTKTSELTNDSNFVSDANYVHTDVNFTSTYETKLNGIATGATKNTAASATPQNVSTTGSVGNGTNYARDNHVHGIALATGDANGQVKIAGTNVSVKGLGSRAYDSTDYLPLSGGTLTGNLLLKKTSSQTNPDTDDPAQLMFRTTYTPSGGSAVNSSATIRAYSDRGNGSGANLVIQPGGNLFIGSGESPEAHYALYKNSGSERTFITADSDVNIQANGNNPIGNRKGLKIQTDGSLVPNVADVATNNAGSIGTSTYKWANVYATKLNGNTIPNGSGTLALTSDVPTAASSAPGKVASSSSTGTSTNYARQDHTHGIDLATGDANGQVKIAGTNVSVKGLGSNAYTSTSYLPLAGGTMTGDVKYTYSTADVTLANNGVSSGIKYPMFKQINDKNGNRIMMIEGLVNSDGTLGIGLNVWNYTYNGTTQTNLYKKGIKMILDKSDTMTYSVDDAANFRTAIGCANNKVTQTSTPLTTDATYRVLLSQNANDTTQTVGARKCSNLTFNPKSGILDVGIDQGGSIDTSGIKIAPYGDNGILDIGNSSNVITRITPATTATSTVDISLPSQSGTLALQENVPSLTWKSGGSKKGTGNYKTSAPSTCSEILLVVNLNDGTTTNIYTCINIPAPIVTATATSTQRFRGGYFQSSTAGGEVSYWIWKASNVFYIAQDIVYMNGTSAASNTTCYVYYR